MVRPVAGQDRGGQAHPVKGQRTGGLRINQEIEIVVDRCVPDLKGGVLQIRKLDPPAEGALEVGGLPVEGDAARRTANAQIPGQAQIVWPLMGHEILQRPGDSGTGLDRGS